MQILARPVRRRRKMTKYKSDIHFELKHKMMMIVMLWTKSNYGGGAVFGGGGKVNHENYK